MNRKTIVRTLATAFVLFALSGGISCGGSPTSPSSCTAGPYNWDANVGRCRASNGQFAASSCCGR